MVVEPLAVGRPGADGSRRSRGKVIAAAVGAAAIVAAGVFAITRISGDSSSGGASSPEAAANDFLDALDKEDVLGLVDLLLPGERDTLRQPMQDIVGELTRLEVLSKDASLSHVDGVDVSVTDRTVDVQKTNVDDIANVNIDAKFAATVKGKDLPIGKWIRDHVSEQDLNDLDATSDPEQSSFPVTVVRRDGRWYVSLFYSIAENARQSDDAGDVPDRGVALRGADSPEALMQAVFTSTADLDLEAMIGMLDPHEFEALQRYAPLFLDDAQQSIDDEQVEVTINNTNFVVKGSGSTRHIVLTAFTSKIDSPSEDPVELELKDGCLIAKGTGDDGDQQTINTCEDVSASVSGVDPAKVKVLQETLQKDLAGYSNPGFTVTEVDGKWYLSPMATTFEQLLALSGALDRGEIEDLADKIGDIIDSMDERGGPFVLPNLDDYTRRDKTSTTTTTVSPDETSSTESTQIGSTQTDSTVSGTTSPDEACYSEDSPATAAQCLTTLVASGRIEESSVPWYLRHLECGAADAYWSFHYYDLSDAEFVQLVAKVAPCFQDLVAKGEVSEYDVPPEIRKPDCLNGINPYGGSVDDETLDQFLDCAYR